MFCVIYGRITFSSVFAITDRRDIGLHDVPMLMPLLGLGTGMMLANFHTCSIHLVVVVGVVRISVWSISV